ncbi:MAG TPA: peptidyl-prolyl cis-trans isomerase [Candidatus Polarisedimenticolaceae bacterium]|nr:peptidyl-prolyl cis-trans isomerase [Candidatus Polarisedimenticolaceae bacterium]
MIRSGLRRALVPAIAVALLASGRPRAEVIEEIVAKINDDVVTKSDLDTEEQGILQELYRSLSGAELDAQVAKAKKLVLRQLIDRKVLLQQASHLFDTTKMKDFYLQQFMSQQNIKSEKDLEKMLSQEGMTLAEWKQKLVEYFAPKEVLRAEVGDHIAISEADTRAYYDAHADDFAVPAVATVREIVITGGSNAEAARARAAAAHDKVTAPGADFNALTSELSEAGTKASGGLLGTIKHGDLAAPLESAAFSQPVGSISPVIEVEGNFFILKVDARTEAGKKPFDDVKDEIETKLRNQRFEAESKVYLQKAWTQATIWVSPKYEARLAPAD